MSKSVVLLTDRPQFEEAWRTVLDRVGLGAQTIAPEGLAERTLEGSVVLVDAACESFDEDELLAIVGLCRACRATCAVALPTGGAFVELEELLEDLCPGLVLRDMREAERLAATLARRADRARAKRFEYVTVSPRPDELLAILADGTAMVLHRPVADGDDGSEVSSIALGEAAESATFSLSSGREVTLRAETVVPNGSRASVPPVNGSTPITIDGARLGARLRELRMAAGLTQAELARRTGIHRPNIARVEAGRHTPSLETLARLATAIGVSTTSVLAEE